MIREQFTLSSPAFVKGDLIPTINTSEGSDYSPFLAWHCPPGSSQSFALIMDDPDIAKGHFTHWILFDIPAEVRELPFNDRTIGIAGSNDFQNVGYSGPRAPQNQGRHRYFFHLFALDVESLKLPAGASRKQVESAMRPHIVGTAELMGCFGHARSHR
ncbi:MAG TPA: YbhB/YbcL family Raf kinase inhibitor-like protein [Pirellulales bacterium]|nr:YbhB/YbcL family Raf kinase inhibitor-like protein [Pirellulales bacterium]